VTASESLGYRGKVLRGTELKSSTTPGPGIREGWPLSDAGSFSSKYGYQPSPKIYVPKPIDTDQFRDYDRVGSINYVRIEDTG
jgi:hypothetical protein